MTRVLLVGLMGSGKSSVARAVAARTGWPVLDNDELLQGRTGLTAAALVAARGVQAVRAAESAVLTELLAMPGPLVAGVAAGVVLDPADRVRLRAGGHVVWLRACVPVLLARLRAATVVPADGRAADRGAANGGAADGHRPFLADDPAGTLSAMAAERDPLFAEVAHQVLDVAQLTPAQAADRVLLALRG